MTENNTWTVSKLGAATALLDAAIKALVEQEDHLSSIVLAGAAEDLLQGQLERGNRGAAASRSQIAVATVAMSGHLSSGKSSLEQRDAFELMRDVYNWLRHDDRGEASERRLDWRKEAVHICMRAIDNYYEVTGVEHPGAATLGYPIGNG